MKNYKFIFLQIAFTILGAVSHLAFADGSKLATNVRAVEFQRDGQVIGVRLFNVTPESGFGRAGFLDGDIIKSMNGTKISDLLQIMTIIADNEKVTAVLLRQEKEMTLEFAGRKTQKTTSLTNDRSGQKTAE